MADLGYNPIKMELEHLKRDLDEARRINQTHQMMNGKLHLEINNLKVINSFMDIIFNYHDIL